MESGTPHPDPIEPPPSLPTKVREIPPRIFCPRCGYDLVGLLPSGHCPECGSPNTNALNPYRLGNASPAFIKRLHIGTMLLQAWILVDCTKILVWDILIIRVSMLSVPFRYSILIAACIVPIMFVGMWLLSSRDPQSLRLPNHNTSRRLLRVVLVAYMISFSVIGLQMIDYGVAYVTARLPMYGLTVLTFACTLIMSIVYLRSLARKIPDDRFRRRASLVLYASVALLILHHSTYPITIVAATYLGNEQAFTTAGFLYSVSSLALYLPFYFLLNRTRLAMKSMR